MSSRSRLWIAVGSMVWIGCQREAPGVPRGRVEATAALVCPAPAANTDPIKDSAAVYDYIAKLEAAKAFHPAAAPTGEERVLTNPGGGGWVPGPAAAVQPEACSHLNPPESLAAGHGRIVAKITVKGAAYPKLRLPQGVSYLWVDGVALPGSGARGVLIPAQPTGKYGPESVAVRVEQHPGYDRNFAEARWLFQPQDDYMWESCVLYGCCYLEGGPAPQDTTQM